MASAVKVTAIVRLSFRISELPHVNLEGVQKYG